MKFALGDLRGLGVPLDRTSTRPLPIVKEIIDARVYNGVHYRTPVVEGAILGRKVAKRVAKFYFQPTDAHVPQGPKRK